MPSYTFRDSKQVTDRIQEITGESITEIAHKSLQMYWRKLTSPKHKLQDVNDYIDETILELECTRINKHTNEVLQVLKDLKLIIDASQLLK